MAKYARLAREIKAVQEGTDFWYHYEADISKGVGLVVGPDDTPYTGGYYFYRFEFPPTYPMAHPKCTFLTAGRNVRFHPNMYTNGYICLSIFGGWAGSSWVPSYTLHSCLLTLSSLLSKNAIQHEPGMPADKARGDPYDDFLSYVNIDIAVCDTLLRPQRFMEPFLPTLDAKFLDNYPKFRAYCDANAGKKWFYYGFGHTGLDCSIPVLSEKLENTRTTVLARVQSRGARGGSGAAAS